MPRRSVVLLTLGLTAAFAACNGDTRNGQAEMADTVITTVPDTVLIEERTIIDTVRDPDLDRDTVHRDTVPGGTPR
jgi:hypothetical protein